MLPDQLVVERTKRANPPLSFVGSKEEYELYAKSMY